MKIGVIGAGAMGSLYGGYLCKDGHEVYLIDVWQEHIDKINKEGLIIHEEDRTEIVKPNATIDFKNLEEMDLVIIFVKSTVTSEAIKNNKYIFGKDTLVLTLQNGYGNIEEIEKYIKKENIIAGTTSHGATLLFSGEIKHAGVGDTKIGWVHREDEEKIKEISTMLNSAGFNTIVCKNVLQVIWDKLIINVGINAITAILEIKNGELITLNPAKDIMIKVVQEAVTVAKAIGINFDEKLIIEKVISVAANTSENKSSMLQDILNKRKTEIDTINGAIVEKGKKFKINTPVNEILIKLIKAKEKL